jgi:hypothetical protein
MSSVVLVADTGGTLAIAVTVIVAVVEGVGAGEAGRDQRRDGHRGGHHLGLGFLSFQRKRIVGFYLYYQPLEWEINIGVVKMSLTM